jgi:hypothetical protein
MRSTQLAHQDPCRIIRKKSFSYCEGAALALPGLIAFGPTGKEERTQPLLLSAPESALRSLPSVAVSSAQVHSVYGFFAIQSQKCLHNLTPGVINTLVLGQLRWPVFSRLSLAGFEVITEAQSLGADGKATAAAAPDSGEPPSGSGLRPSPSASSPESPVDVAEG